MIRAKWVNGRAIPEDEIDWPEGTIVYVSRTPLPDGDATDLANQDDDLTSVAAWLEWYDSLEPLVYAAGEEAEIEAQRRQVGDYTLQNMEQQIDGVFE